MATNWPPLALLLVLLAAALHGGAWAQAPSPAPSSMARGPSSAGPRPPPASGPSSAGEPVPSSAGAVPPMAPGPAAPSDCMTILIENVAPCLTYVEAGSNLTRPEEGCCGGLKTVVNNNPLCLCSLLSPSGNTYGIDVNRTRALTLPSVCKVETPPVSLCSVLEAPAPTPGGGGGGGSTSGSSPVGSPTAGGDGSTAAPPSGNGAGRSFRSSAPAVLAGLALAAVGIL